MRGMLPVSWLTDLFFVTGLRVCCALLGHPPSTSLYWDGKVENEMERTTNVLAMKGATVRVSCACGGKMVDPVWRPAWRERRERRRRGEG